MSALKPDKSPKSGDPSYASILASAEGRVASGNLSNITPLEEQEYMRAHGTSIAEGANTYRLREAAKTEAKRLAKHRSFRHGTIRAGRQLDRPIDKTLKTTLG